MKQAVTRMRNAADFIAVVSNCALLPQRMPRHCKTAKPRITLTEIIFTWAPARAGKRCPLYSLMTIAPADDEAGVIAQCAPGKIVLATASRNCRSQLRHGGGADKRVKPADNPDPEEEPGIGQTLRDIAGRADDSRSDGVADGHGDAKPHSEHLQQVPAIWLVGRCGSGRRFRCVRQYRSRARIRNFARTMRHDTGEMRKSKRELAPASQRLLS